MKNCLIAFLSFAFLSFSQEKIHVLYSSLDPLSVPEHLAFYQLFPDTPEGGKALADAWELLCGSSSQKSSLQYLPKSAIDSIVTIVTKAEGVETSILSAENLKVIQEL